MKVFIASLLILVLMIAGGVACDFYLQSVGWRDEHYADQIDEAAELGDFTAVRSAYEDLQQYWDDNVKYLTALVDHAHTVEIDKSLKELEMGLAVEEEVEVMLSSARVRMEITSIANDEHLHIKNIL